MACNSNCLIERNSPGHSHSHIHCMCGNISVSVQGVGVVTTAHREEVVYGLSNAGNSCHLEWLSRSFTYCKPFQVGFFFVQCRCVAGDKISADIVQFLCWVSCTVDCVHIPWCYRNLSPHYNRFTGDSALCPSSRREDRCRVLSGLSSRRNDAWRNIIQGAFPSFVDTLSLTAHGKRVFL